MEPAEENYQRCIKCMKFSARLSLRLMEYGYKEAKKELAEVKAAREPEKELKHRLSEAQARADRQIAIAYMQGGISKDDRDALLGVTRELTKHSSIDDGCVKLASLKGITKDFEELNLKRMETGQPYPPDMAKDVEKIKDISAERVRDPDRYVKDVCRGDLARERVMKAHMDTPLDALRKAAAEELTRLMHPKGKGIGLDPDKLR